jgi:transposase, IS6 family
LDNYLPIHSWRQALPTSSTEERPATTPLTTNLDVLQLSGLLAGDVKQSRNGNPTRALQVATDRTRHHPLCRPVVSRYSLSLRDVEELLEERGLHVDHTTVWRWVRYYGPELEQRLRLHLKPTNKSWRVDETYVRVKGRRCYLYRAIDSAGATIDFLQSAFRDADAAKRLFRKALGDRSHPQPRVINTDLAPTYSSAIPDSKKEGTLRNRCRHRPVQYLNNILESRFWIFGVSLSILIKGKRRANWLTSKQILL